MNFLKYIWSGDWIFNNKPDENNNKGEIDVMRSRLQTYVNNQNLKSQHANKLKETQEQNKNEELENLRNFQGESKDISKQYGKLKSKYEDIYISKIALKTLKLRREKMEEFNKKLNESIIVKNKWLEDALVTKKYPLRNKKQKKQK